MAHDPLTLLLHVGDSFATMFRHGPRFEARLTAESWFASGGDAHCIWNWVGLTNASTANVAMLRESISRLRERRIEGLVCYPLDVEGELAETCRELGLGEPGVVPLMACAPADLPALAPTDVAVEQMTGAALLAGAIAVISASFEIPVYQTARTFTAGLLEEPAVAAYSAVRDGVVTGVLAATRFGDSVSIDIMAVDPAAQRQGIGRALILAAMHDQVASGATGFHLLSSEEGKRLYDEVGFTTALATHTRLIPLDPILVDQVVA